MSGPKFRPTPEQKTASDPARSVWVGANAGAGKTHVLVERIIRLMLDGAKPSAILCLTFTKAAAAEMADRLYLRLGAWIGLDDEALVSELTNLGLHKPEQATLQQARRLFTTALETPGGLKIQTIHAFCERLLQLFPVEADIAPGFKVMEERQTADLLSRAEEVVLRGAERGQDHDLSEALRTVTRFSNAKDFQVLLRKILSSTQGLGDHLANPEIMAAMNVVLHHAFKLDINQEIISIRNDVARFDRSALQNAVNELAKNDLENAQAARATFINVLNMKSTDQIFECFRDFALTVENKPRKSILSKGVIKQLPEVGAWVVQEHQRLVDLFVLHDLKLRIKATIDLVHIAHHIHQHFEAAKRRGGYYDFDDLIGKTVNLLTGTHQAAWILYKLDAGLQHILIDEAQDTSPLQWKIIDALAAEFFAGAGQPQNTNRTLFVVGDRKQSIYRFQGADVASFGLARTKFESQTAAASRPLTNVNLTISYRTAQNVLNVIDHVFATGRPARHGLDDIGVPLDFDHISERKAALGVFQLWPLVEPEAEVEVEPWQAPVDRESLHSTRRRLAKKIAATIKLWLGQRILVAENRVVQPSDILILLQTRSNLFRNLVAELRLAGVPVAGADRLKLLESLAVQDLLALTQFCLLPRDDYSLACVLKSPLMPIPITEIQLQELAIGRGQETLWQRLQVSNDASLQVNAAWLNTVFQRAKTARPFDFFNFVLQARRKAMVGRLGAEALDASSALLDLTLIYEQDRDASLAGFLHWFQATETEIKREMDKSAGEVRIMTVHGAKGLEANIVFLADAVDIPSNNRGGQILRAPFDQTSLPTLLWSLPGMAEAPEVEAWKDVEKDKALQERHRLLYVAMTRARDELYICGARGKNSPSTESWYHVISSALDIPNPRLTLHSMREDLGEGQVLHLGPDMVWGKFEQTDLIQLPHLPNWALRVVEKEGPDFAIRNSPVVVNQEMQWGIVLHRLMEDLLKLAFEKQENFASRKCAKAGMPRERGQDLVALINRPDLKPYFVENGQSEVAFTATSGAGQTIQGRIDRLIISENKVVILDYKSDRQRPSFLTHEHNYAKQLAVYQSALQLAYPGFHVTCAILWLFHAELEWLDDEILRAAIPNSA